LISEKLTEVDEDDESPFQSERTSLDLKFDLKDKEIIQNDKN